MTTAELKIDNNYMADLKADWSAFKSENPKIRIRNAAQDLNCSEAELVATGVGITATRLNKDWGNIIRGFEKLGEILCITRNDDAVHEKVGKFACVSISPGHALVLNREIDLRIFFGNWHFGFAVQEETGRGIRKSLQFFDLSGASVHKVYLRDDSDQHAYNALVREFRATDQFEEIATVAAAPIPAEADDSTIDADGLRKHWLALQDVHDFMALLRDFGVARQQALRLVGSDLAFEVSTSAFRYALEEASKTGLSIMVFVSNKGCVQIHTGPIKRVVEAQGWLNILDPGFDLHVRENKIDKAWVVRKPTVDGMVTSLELYDDKGKQILIMFGERKPNNPELEQWAKLCAELPK